MTLLQGGAFQFIGFALMPWVASLFSIVNFNLFFLSFNAYTSPVWFLFTLNLFAVPLIVYLDKATPPKKPTNLTEEDTSNLCGIYAAAITCIVLNFLARSHVRVVLFSV